MMLRIGNNKGFTLVEIMVAITILAIGIIGVLRSYTVAINALEASQYSIEAACLLKEKMADVEKEVIEKKDFSQGTYQGEFKGNYGGFKWESQVQVLDFDNEEMKNCLNEIKMTVYNNRIKPPRRFSLVTYIENYEEYYK